MLLTHLPAGSATHRALVGADAEWTLEAQLLAAMVDGIAVGNWQRQGDNNATRPQQIPRPGVTPAGRPKPTFGRGRTMEQLRRSLRPNQPRPPGQEVTDGR